MSKEKMYRLSTVLKYIEKHYENVLTPRKIEHIECGLDEDE